MAAFAGRPIWAAVVGAGLVLAYWGLEALTWWRARARRDLAVGVALGGMALRLAAVLGGLVLVGVVARPAFATAALAFLASFTVYMGFRLFTYPASGQPAGTARSR